MRTSIFQRLSRAVSGVLIAMMLVSTLLVPTTAAQQQSIVSQLTGATITYGPPYELLPDLGYADETMEMIAFAGAADILAMGFLPPLIDLNGARDVFLEGFFGEFEAIYNLDAGSYDGVSYSLDITNVDGTEVGVFSLFMNNRSHGFAEYEIFIAPPALFGATMQTMQNTIAINGVGLMRGVDATAMGNMVVANIGSTGGTAATDVTEVQQSTEHQTTTTQTDSPGRDEYVTQVQAEFAYYTTHLQTVLDTTDQLAAQTITAQDARAIMDEAHAALALSNSRAAAITPPAGMESFHSEFLATADAMTTMGVTWESFVSGNVTTEAYTVTVTDAMSAYGLFATTLDREVNATSTVVQTTTSSDSADASEYLAAVQGQRDSFHNSFTFFTENLGQFGEAMTDEKKQEHLQATYDEAASWATYADTANGLIPPAGYEGVHAAYLAWASEVATLGNTWTGLLMGEGPTTEDFSNQVAKVQTAEDALDSELTAVGTAQTNTGPTTETTTSTRTTRGTTTDVTPEATEATTRTGRTTRGTTTDVTPEPTETTSRTNRTTRGTTTTTDNSLTNISETKGTRGSSVTTQQNGTDAAEWLAPQFDVLVTWNDEYSLYEGSDGTTSSDTASGLDQVNLQWEDADGNYALIFITVMEGQAGDPALIGDSLTADPALVEQYFGEGSELVDYDIADESTGLLVHLSDGTNTGWLYTQFTCIDASCSQLVRVQIVTDGTSMPLVLQSMRAGVAADDVSLTDAMRPRTIESAIAAYEG